MDADLFDQILPIVQSFRSSGLVREIAGIVGDLVTALQDAGLSRLEAVQIVSRMTDKFEIKKP